MRFKLLHGTFDPKNGKKLVKAGEVFDHAKDLCKIFPNKFQLIPESEAPTPLPPKEVAPTPKPFPKPAPVPVPVPAPAPAPAPVVSPVQSAVRQKVTLPVPPAPPVLPPVSTPPPKPAGRFGANVTDKYPTAAAAGLLVFCKGTHYTVTDENTPNVAKNKTTLNRKTLVPFLTKEIGA